MSNFNSAVADNSALLNAYMYLDFQDKNLKGMSLESALAYIKQKHPKKANSEEFRVIEKACRENPSLGKMKIVSQSHYDHNNVVKGAYSKGNDCKKDYIQACAFEDENGNLYVAFRGTGDRRWGDNGQGYVDESTDMQETAKEYFDHVVGNNKHNNLYVTGHSKGGNEAQYVTMTSKYQDEITNCYSMEGQGFSDDAIKKFKQNPKYKDVLSKIYSINSDNDPVHKLIGVIVPEENTYYVNTHYQSLSGENEFTYFHNILGIIVGPGIDWQRDKDGNIIRGTEGDLSKFGGELNDRIQKLPKSIKGSCAIALMKILDILKGGSMDDAEANSLDFFLLKNVGIPAIFVSLGKANLDLTDVMFEKYGIAGAIATFISGFSVLAMLGVIAKNIVGTIEIAYAIKALVDNVEEIISKIKEICKKAGAWAKDFVNDVVLLFNRFKEWLYHNSTGYKYSSANPYISVDTTSMSLYASQLRNLSRRSKSLDWKMNSLYWQMGIDWNSLAKLGKLLKVGVNLDCAGRLDMCANYLESTANEFNDVERGLLKI